MKLGMFTACFPDLTLTEVASWAAAAGYQALEVASWPAGSDRPYTPCHLDVGSFDPEEVLGMFETRGLVLSSLAFYDNNLHPDPVMRLRVNEHLRACIDSGHLRRPRSSQERAREPAGRGAHLRSPR